MFTHHRYIIKNFIGQDIDLIYLVCGQYYCSRQNKIHKYLKCKYPGYKPNAQGGISAEYKETDYSIPEINESLSIFED